MRRGTETRPPSQTPSSRPVRQHARVSRTKPGTPGRSARYPPIRHGSGKHSVPMPLVSSNPEPTVPALRDAFMNGREWGGERRKAAGGPEADHPSAPTFQAGAEWVRRVLVPAIERANTELQPVDVAFKLDLNLDPRSTNHAHADFWLSELGAPSRHPATRHLAIMPNSSAASWSSMSISSRPYRSTLP